MGLKRTMTLFEAATRRGRVIKQGEFVQMIFDGAGAVVVPAQDYQQVSKWAQSKVGSGNNLTDRGRFLEQFTVLISRPGSVASTRGHERQVERLAKSMIQGGFDISEWNLPPELRDLGKHLPKKDDKDVEKDDAKETPAPEPVVAEAKAPEPAPVEPAGPAAEQVTPNLSIRRIT